MYAIFFADKIGEGKTRCAMAFAPYRFFNLGIAARLLAGRGGF